MLCGRPQPLDDAFITLRYARSLAQGERFAFNPGERVLGTTTPLFTVVLAFMHRLTAADLVWLAYALAAAAHLGCVLMLVSIGRRCGWPIAGWVAAAVYACAPLALFPTVGCMETSAFVLATLVALAPAERADSPGCSIGAAAAMLLRPEGMLTLALYVMRVVSLGRRRVLRVSLWIVGPLAAWLLFATAYFGTPIPQSMPAKWSYRAFLP